jgi:hypothetical protein
MADKAPTERSRAVRDAGDDGTHEDSIHGRLLPRHRGVERSGTARRPAEVAVGSRYEKSLARVPVSSVALVGLRSEGAPEGKPNVAVAAGTLALAEVLPLAVEVLPAQIRSGDVDGGREHLAADGRKDERLVPRPVELVAPWSGGLVTFVPESEQLRHTWSSRTFVDR